MAARKKMTITDSNVEEESSEEKEIISPESHQTGLRSEMSIASVKSKHSKTTSWENSGWGSSGNGSGGNGSGNAWGNAWGNSGWGNNTHSESKKDPEETHKSSCTARLRGGWGNSGLMRDYYDESCSGCKLDRAKSSGQQRRAESRKEPLASDW